jgi:2-desacetyl-2-hydroxyethyl bacteriochlorophyllide A dehydrogenase
MKAAVFHGPRDVRFEQVDLPTLSKGEVLLRVRACGICGSDLHTYRHGMFLDLGSEVENGRILGHEFSGEVAEVCGDVPGVQVGDRVVSVGMGANAEFVKLSATMVENLIVMDSKTSFIEAATTEPLATSLHATNLGEAKDGETHVIMGAGIIGLGILQCIKARSNASVIVVDLSDKRLSKAIELGADITINARDTDAVDEILKLTGSEQLGLVDAVQGNVDAVYDCAGLGKNFTGTSVLEQALSVAKVNGKVVVVAVFEKNVSIDYNIVMRKGLKVLGSWAWTMDEFVEAANLIRSGKIDRKPLVSHTFSLEQASEAYETQLLAEAAVKVVFTPWS